MTNLSGDATTSKTTTDRERAREIADGDDARLIAKLRDSATFISDHYQVNKIGGWSSLRHAAADKIEQQAARIRELEAAPSRPPEPAVGGEAKPARIFDPLSGEYIDADPDADEYGVTETGRTATYDDSPTSTVGKLRQALGEAIDIFDGMNDDEINVDLLPRLRAVRDALPVPDDETTYDREALDLEHLRALAKPGASWTRLSMPTGVVMALLDLVPPDDETKRLRDAAQAVVDDYVAAGVVDDHIDELAAALASPKSLRGSDT
jgi:hypothetical protein